MSSKRAISSWAFAGGVETSSAEGAFAGAGAAAAAGVFGAFGAFFACATEHAKRDRKASTATRFAIAAILHIIEPREHGMRVGVSSAEALQVVRVKLN
ncbi:MAG: hypothetical protein NTX64_16545 [Elusimicrobia bacterium]|nr:hypothetical protein [Elusimicrobiota bacterium]